MKQSKMYWFGCTLMYIGVFLLISMIFCAEIPIRLNLLPDGILAGSTCLFIIIGTMIMFKHENTKD